MLPKSLRLGFLLSFLALSVLCISALWLHVIIPTNDVVPAALIATAVMLTILSLEWRGIFNLVRVARMPLSQVEKRHPFLPDRTEASATLVLSTCIVVLCGQFALTAQSAALPNPLDVIVDMSSSSSMPPPSSALSSTISSVGSSTPLPSSSLPSIISSSNSVVSSSAFSSTISSVGSVISSSQPSGTSSSAGTSVSGVPGGTLSSVSSSTISHSSSKQLQGVLSGVVFADDNANGTYDQDEKGIVDVHIDVRDALTGNVHAVQTESDGSFAFTLPNDAVSRTYIVTVKMDSSALAELTPSTVRQFSVAVIGTTGGSVPPFGMRDPTKLGSAPCLHIDTSRPMSDAHSLTSDQILLSLLRTKAGIKLPTLGEAPLVRRASFIALLVKSQCMDDPPLDSAGLATALRQYAQSAKASPLPAFVDLPSTDSRAMNAYIAAMHGVPIAKQAKNGPVIDTNTPVTLPEAVAMMIAVIRNESAPPLSDDAALSILKNIGIIPASYDPTTSAHRGISPIEAAAMLAKLALAEGRIFPSSPPDHAQSSVDSSSAFTQLRDRLTDRCLAAQPDRHVSWHSIEPGHTDFTRMTKLLLLGRIQSSGIQWLVSPVLSENGLYKGVLPYDGASPVPTVELLRTLIVGFCMHIPTIEQQQERVLRPTASLLTTGATGEQVRGKEDRLFQRGRLDPSLVARMAYAAQDPDNENISLLQYATSVLDNARTAMQPLTLHDALLMTSSAFAGEAVRQKIVESNGGSNAADQAYKDLFALLTGKQPAQWGESTYLKIRSQPFTRTMFITLLSSVYSTSLSHTPDPDPLSVLRSLIFAR